MAASCHQEAGVNMQLTRGLWDFFAHFFGLFFFDLVVFCSVFCHLGGMEAISTTDSENEAEPQENSHHTPFASPLETPHHYFWAPCQCSYQPKCMVCFVFCKSIHHPLSPVYWQPTRESENIIFNVGLFYFSLSFLIGNLARSGANGLGAAAVQQMEATMGGRDTTDGRDTRDIRDTIE